MFTQVFKNFWKYGNITAKSSVPRRFKERPHSRAMAWWHLVRTFEQYHHFCTKFNFPRPSKMIFSFLSHLYYPNQRVSISDSITRIDLNRFRSFLQDLVPFIWVLDGTEKFLKKSITYLKRARKMLQNMLRRVLGVFTRIDLSDFSQQTLLWKIHSPTMGSLFKEVKKRELAHESGAEIKKRTQFTLVQVFVQ